MKRIAEIAFSVMESRSTSRKVLSRASQNEDLQNMKGYKYFQSIVRDVFFSYVDNIGSICKSKCLEEVNCTNLIHWETESKT
jgi:hypothetical protein